MAHNILFLGVVMTYKHQVNTHEMMKYVNEGAIGFPVSDVQNKTVHVWINSIRELICWVVITRKILSVFINS